MKKLIIIIIVLILAGVSSFFIFKPNKQAVDKTAKLTQRDLQVQFRETGTVSPRNRLEIKPPFAGRIEEILVEEGDKIKKGQIIIRMSSSERAAMLDAARAMGQEEYDRWQNIYKATPIVAPMDGFIILRSKEPGQTVTSADAVLVMADDLIIESKVDETDLRYIKIGDKLQIYLDAYPDETFEGITEHISYESTVVSNVTVYSIRIKPVKKPPVFRAGMTATITITAESKKDAQTLPNNFITERNGKKSVIVQTGKGGKAVFGTKQITTGITDGRFTEILSGITPNDTVVIFKTSSKQKAKSFMSRP
ncbi:MAG: efflux RND transporter periplasmic adaptor subunit [Endomicrobium sp.]|jgi:macrolide-specific efflux system membrane fusion protein|nr:efflux RND transporter periplasmic adaptor subunit [Endomicrobium sp.]